MKTNNSEILDLEINRKKTPSLIDNTTVEVSKEQKDILDGGDRISDWLDSILGGKNNNNSPYGEI